MSAYAKDTSVPGAAELGFRVKGRPVRLTLNPDGECLRCGSKGFLIVGLTTALWEDEHLCLASCAVPEWQPCPKCSGVRVPQHVRWCPVAHPEAREKWLAQLPVHMEVVAKLLPLVRSEARS